MDVLDDRLNERPFDMRIIDLNTFELNYDQGGKLTTRVFPFDQEVRDPDNSFILNVERSPYFNEQTLPRLVETDYQFVRHNRNTLVNKYKSTIGVKNQEFTTILDITVEDEVGVRAKMFLDTLSTGVHRYTLQSEFDINENTLNYIDKQLAEVTVILERTRTNCRTTRRTRTSWT
jgi:hypothetical protein